MTVSERLGAISGGTILDIATGDGAFIQFLKQHLHDFSDIIGIDSEERLVQQAQAAFAGDSTVRILQMDSTRLEFPDQHFDLVGLSNSLHHIVQLDATFQEMRPFEYRNTGFDTFVNQEKFAG